MEHPPRAPEDPGGLGDGARVLPRETRLRLAAEHAGLDAGEVDTMVDPKASERFAASG